MMRSLRPKGRKACSLPNRYTDSAQTAQAADRVETWLMRILVLNSAVFAEKVGGETWSHLEAKSFNQQLWASGNHVVIDDDLFIIDAEKIPQVGSLDAIKRFPQDVVRSISQGIRERVVAGGCLICFAGEAPMPWLPVGLDLRPFSGQRISVNPRHGTLSDLLRKYRAEASYKVQFEVSGPWTTVASSTTKFPVAVYVKHGSGYIVLLPQFKNRGKVAREFLDKVVPTYLPGLVDDRPAPPESEKPTWLADFPLTQAEKLSQEISDLGAEIQRLGTERADKEQQRADLLRFQNLLWYEGRALEAEVMAALQLLGMQVRPGPEGRVDLIGRRDDGREVYIEVEGTKGAINITKGRQLADYINSTDDPANTEGAIIGNPFREHHPSLRPPVRSQVGSFSPQLEAMAKKYGWALVTTTELFEWVRRHLDGDAEASAEAHKALRLE